MATLEGQTIAASYEQLLHVDTDGGGNTTTLVPVKDGDNGTTFCLQLATTSALIEGSGSKLYFSDAGGEYISGDGTNLTITSGADIILAVGTAGSVYSSGDGGTSNTIYGANAGDALASGGNYNVVLGGEAGTALTTGVNNVAVGYNALLAGTTETDDNVAIGYNAMGGAIAAEVVNDCVAIGSGSLAGALDSTDGADESSGTVAIGKSALAALTDGSGNLAIGFNALAAQTTGTNNIIIGREAGTTGSPGGNITTASHTLILGDEQITSANIQVDWTVASDARDKTDVIELDLGLEFVNKLIPVTYRWDKRSNYVDKLDPTVDLNKVTTDGTHKENQLDVGFLAQDVAEVESSYGYEIKDKRNLTTSLSGDGKQYSTKYSKFVPMLVKAVQELSEKVEVQQKRIEELEDN